MGSVLLENLERHKQAFLKASVLLHGSKFDYSLVEYINTHTKVKIVCPIHGIFEQTPSRHLNSRGCNKCRILKTSGIESFLRKSKSVHGERYDYSLVNYVNNDTPITVICREHGEFFIRPRSHTSSKSGCPKCWSKQIESPIERAKKKFKNKFVYTDEAIICPEHGPTGYNIHQHLKTTFGCAECYEQSRRISKKEYIEKADKLHDYKYDYNDIQFESMADDIVIVCPIHGAFTQVAGAHIYEKKGCWQCSCGPLSTDEFIKKSREVFGDKFCYDLVHYQSYDSKITIICKDHGVFHQRAGNHLAGMIGCRRCSSSSLQEKVTNELVGEKIITCDRQILKPYEIDIFLPKWSLGIETHGNYWHSYNYLESNKERMRHSAKADLAVDIKLLQFFEHEINHKWDIVLSMINHHLGKSTKINARDCQVQRLSCSETKNFTNSSHISGFVAATIYYGLISDGELRSVASFTKKQNFWEITRYSSAIGYCVVGGFSRLLARFIRDQNPSSLYTFADRRFSKANVYTSCGFEVVAVTKPNYCYLNSSGSYVGPRQQFQKHKLASILPKFDKSITEAENMFMNGYRRLWDAGSYKLKYPL